MSNTTARVTGTRESAGLSQAIEGGESSKRFQGGAAVLRLCPACGLLGRDRSPANELAVAGADDLVRESRKLLGRQVPEGGGGPLVVLVLEPGESLDPAEYRADLQGALLPRRCPAFLVCVLGPDLEQEAHAI